MRLTYGHLVGSGLTRLLKRLQGEPMTIATAYKITKLAAKIDAELAEALRLFSQIGEKYGEKSEGGIKMLPNGFHSVPKEHQAEYRRELSDFLQIEFETGMEKLKASELGHLKVSPTELPVLELIAEPLA